MSKAPSDEAFSKSDAKRLYKEGRNLLAKNRKKVPEATAESLEEKLNTLRQTMEQRNPGSKLTQAAQDLERSLEKDLGFARKSSIRELVDSVVIAVLIAGFLRAFVLEAFKIPSGSMIPTLKVGDHLFVNKFIYGLRSPMPMSNSWLVRWGSPDRGDVIVFRYPVNQSKDYIKRIVGIAGDKVLVVDDKVLINGEALNRTPAEDYTYYEDRECPGWLICPVTSDLRSGFANRAVLFTESSHADPDTQYTVIYNKQGLHKELPEFKTDLPGLDCSSGKACLVKEGYVLVMGDNRDNSSDGRVWGGVPETFIKGKAMFIFGSRAVNSGIRWDRIGQAVR